MADPHQINVWTHIAAGAVALAVGLVPLFSRKGGPLHRWSGRVTAGLGVLVLGSATLATLLFNPPAPLMAATLSAGYQYLSAGKSWRPTYSAVARKMSARPGVCI